MKINGKNRIFLFVALVCAFMLSLSTAYFTANAEATSTPVVSGAYVVLNEDIVVRYIVNVPEGYTSAMATYTYKGEEYQTTKSVTTGENEFSFAEVTPANIGENVEMSVTLTGEGRTDITATVDTFSVADYCGKLLSNAPSSFEFDSNDKYEAMRALTANFIAYSGALQEYVGRENTATDTLVTAAQNAIVKTEVPTETDFAIGTGNASSTVSWAGANLLLGSRVNMAFYFYSTDGVENATLDITPLGGETVTIDTFTTAGVGSTSGNTVYCGVWEGVSVVDFDKTFTAQLKVNGEAVGNTATYSVKSYVYKMQSSTNVKMKALATALYNYGVAAKEYTEALAETGRQPVTTSSSTTLDVALATLPEASPVATVAKAWGSVGDRAYSASLTTDGEYFYTLGYYQSGKDPDGNGYRASFRIVKMDKSFNVLGNSADFNGGYTGSQYGGYEYNTPLFIKDGYAYSFNASGDTVRVKTADLTAENVELETNVANATFTFGGITTTSVNAVAYDPSNEKFAVVSGTNTLSVFAASDLTTATATATVSNITRMAAANGKIYLTVSADAQYNPDIQVYGFDGVKLGTVKAGVTAGMVNSSDSERSKVEGIAVVDGNLYLSIIGWSPVPSSTKIFKVSFAKVANTGFGEIILGNYEYTLTAESVSNGYISPYGAFIYNIVEKDGWFYIASGSGYGTLKICRYNPVSKQLVARTETFAVKEVSGTENVAMFTKGGKLYVYATDGWKSVPLGFAEGAAFTSCEIPVNLGTDTNKNNFTNIWYWEEMKRTVLYRTDNWVVMLDENGAEVKAWQVSHTKAVHRLGGDDQGFVYFADNAQGAVTPSVTVIDLRTYGKTQLTLPSVAENGGSSKIESVFGYNGSVYYSVLQWSGTNGSNIQKVTYANVTEAVAAPHMSLGENVELAAQNNATLTLTPSTTLVVNNLATTVKGVVSDGTYFYLACCHSAGQVFIVKMNKQGVIIGKTAAWTMNANDVFGDTTYLLVDGGYVYAYGIVHGSNVYRVKTDAITMSGTATVESTTLPVATTIQAEAMTHESVSGRYAIRTGTALYLLNADGTTYKTVANAIAGKYVGVECDEHYVYVLTEKNGGLKFNVFDWEGNKVGEFEQATGLYDATQANVASIVVEDGKVYIFAKPWGSQILNVVVVDLSSVSCQAE